jgi:hypothetical protein
MVATNGKPKVETQKNKKESISTLKTFLNHIRRQQEKKKEMKETIK